MEENQKITILSVDDREENLYARNRVLRREGYAIVEASNGADALRLVAELKPPLVLLDVQMPDINGLEVCRRIKNDPHLISTYVLQISASLIEPQDKAKALDGGADAYLTEPVEPEELLATVRALLRLQKAETDLRSNQERLARALETEQKARLEAENATRLKDEFLATVSHELRTPLNAILGWATMLNKGILDETAARQAAQTIERNARSQNQLIEDLLDVSRIISGKIRLNVQPVALAPVIEAALDTVKPAADARGIIVQSILDPNAGPISGDADRLQQIVWNLLSNAIKFTPKGGKVQVRLEQINSHVEIIVADSGDGIENDFLAFVFDRFRQADSSSKRQYNGLGLGLSIVRHLTEMHGGTVAAFSDGAGAGATFIIKLPRLGIIQTAAHKRHPRTDGAANADADEKLDLSGVRILVVDDDDDTRRLLALALGENAAEVSLAESVAEAVRRLETEAFDLLVSDIEMPVADGFDLIRQVRETSSAKHLPAIAVTAYARTQDRVRAINAGFNAHVSKPVEFQELLAIVKSLIKN